jgi:hypothetical protein
MLITGIKINKTECEKHIPSAFIFNSIAYLVFFLLLPAIMIDAAINGSEEAPVWVAVGSLITELMPVYLISKVFEKMSEKN